MDRSYKVRVILLLIPLMERLSFSLVTCPVSWILSYVISRVQVNFKLLNSSSFLPAVGCYCSGTMLSILVNMNLIIFMLQFLILQDSDWMTEMRIKSR